MSERYQLRVESLRGGYGKKEIVHGVSFTIDAGDVLCILGPNGCGKSTLLRLLMRFLPRVAGRIMFCGENTDQLSRKEMARIFSYIPQSGMISFPYTALEIVMMARTSHLSSISSPGKADIEIAMSCLDKMKIGHLSNIQYNEMSGGQRQLVLIARALCQDAGVLVMDEPSSSLDFANQQLINEAVRMIVSDGRIIIFTTHSPSQPFEIASKVLLLDRGCESGFGLPDDILNDAALEKIFGIPMEIVTVTDRNKNRRKICLGL